MEPNQFYKFWQCEISSINSSINRFSNIAVVGIYGSGIGKLADIILNEKHLNTNILSINLKDLPAPSTQDLYQIFATEINDKLGIEIDRASSDFAFYYSLRRMMEQNDKLNITFVIQSSHYLLNLPDGFLSALDNFLHLFKSRANSILFSDPHILSTENFSIQNIISKNYIFIHEFDCSTSIADIEEIGKFYNFDFTKHFQQIFSISNGHHGIIKYLCEKLATGQIRHINQRNVYEMVKTDSRFKMWIGEAIDGLSKNHKSLVCEYIETGNICQKHIQTHEFGELDKLGIFHSSGKRVRFLFESFKDVIVEKLEHQMSLTNESLSVKNNSILFRGITVSEVFNCEELKTMIAFIHNEGEVISYEQLAEIIWEDKADAKFSLWAINKLISRIREKLQSLGLQKQTITTIRKVGYVYRKL